MKLKAMLFDAGDVLYHRPRRYVALTEFLAQLGLSPHRPRDAPALALKRQAHAGTISRDAYFDAVLKLCGVRDSAALAKGRSILDRSQIDIEFFAGVAETLHRLKAAGLRLGVVTNTFDSTRSKHGWFRKVGIDSVWDSFATSCELGIVKPDPGIYQAALDPLDVAPHEAAFVGHAATELEGAKALGMTTIAFNRDDENVTADHVISTFPELLNVADIRS